MYCIVFSGRLLDGHDPQVVRKAVAARLNLDAAQVERLFSGKRVVLKKGVTEESGRLYLNVLRRLGMDAGMARIPRSQDTVQALATFKIVFWGRVIDGFDRRAVMQAAAVKLKTQPAQIERMFEGAKVVLKRGVSADVGTRYVVELARIGMQIDLEVETVEQSLAAKSAQASPEQIVVPRTSLSPEQRSRGQRRESDEAFAGLLQTQFEMPATTDYADDDGTPVLVDTPSFVKASSYAAPLDAPPKPAVRQTAPTRSTEYVRCEQCGHRQAAGSRCRACGTELLRIAQPQRTPIPMDASAYATPTTILGNMPAAMMRSSVATTAPAQAEDLRGLLQTQGAAPRPRSALRKNAPALLGAALVLTIVLLLVFR